LTHGHKHDFFLLEKLIEGPHPYLGMIGSRKKAKEALGALKEKGISQEAIDKVHSPVGLPIGGNSPAEIAVSICAELVQVRNELKKPKKSE
jgi:xanthine dehydrogenase accessory factor